MSSHEPKLILIRGITGAGKTTVAKYLAEVHGFAIVEVDDVKLRRYGTTTKCKPANDFPEAGQEAQTLLDSGRHVVVVEAFVDEKHLTLLFSGMETTVDSPGTSVFWLECGQETATNRKREVLSTDVVASQYRRLPSRHRVPGEIVLRTDSVPVEGIASRIMSVLFPNEVSAR